MSNEQPKPSTEDAIHAFDDVLRVGEAVYDSVVGANDLADAIQLIDVLDDDELRCLALHIANEAGVRKALADIARACGGRGF